MNIHREEEKSVREKKKKGKKQFIYILFQRENENVVTYFFN